MSTLMHSLIYLSKVMQRHGTSSANPAAAIELDLLPPIAAGAAHELLNSFCNTFVPILREAGGSL